MKYIITLAFMLTLAACASEQEERKPEFGTLTRTLTMVDKEGRQFGTVELDPVGGGKLFDNDGRVIGRVTSPDR